MSQLGCNYSKPLMELLHVGAVHVDWIKLSRADTLLAEIAECQGVRPALVHTLGWAGMEPERFAAIDWNGLNQAVAAAGSPHIAIHLQTKEGQWAEEPTRGQVVARMSRQIGVARERLQVPLLVENVPYSSQSGTLRPCGEPDFIRELLQLTGTGLLLDTSHLRCAAFNLGMDEREYALALPLERVREIHVSGSRIDERGELRDRHMSLQDADYAFLEWVLERSKPAMVTLEYGGTGPIFERPGMTDAGALVLQLGRLKEMLL